MNALCVLDCTMGDYFGISKSEKYLSFFQTTQDTQIRNEAQSFFQESTCQCRRRRFDPWVGKIPLRRKWQPTPVFVPGKPHGQKSLAGYNPWGHKRIRHGLATNTTRWLIRYAVGAMIFIYKAIANHPVLPMTDHEAEFCEYKSIFK